MVANSSFYDRWMLRYIIKFLFDILQNNFASSGRGRMNLPPFDSSRRGESKELLFILLRSLGAELFCKKLNGAVTANQKIIKCRTLDILLDISASSNRRRMKLPPFDSF
jgi:hypothetical protein